MLFGITQWTFFSMSDTAPTRQSIAMLASEYASSRVSFFSVSSILNMAMEASFIALLRSASLTWVTRYLAVSLVGRSMSSFALAFFGFRQWMPFLTLTTCDTR